MHKKRFVFSSTVILLLLLLGSTVVHAQTPTATPVPLSHVVILVVDDFTPKTEQEIADIVNPLPNPNKPTPTGDPDKPTPTVDPDKPTPTEIVNNPGDPTLCYFNPMTLVEGQAMADGMGGAVVDAVGHRISHGDLVLSQTLEMIDKNLKSNPFPNVEITAIPVSVNNYVIEDIATAIQSTITNLKARLGANTYFVINMSFALVPCKDYQNLTSLLNDFGQAEAATAGHPSKDKAEWDEFKRTLDVVEAEVTQVVEKSISISNRHCDIVTSASGASAITVAQEIEPTATAIVSEANECTLRQLFFDNNVIAVASSGNFGLPFPTLPAAWEGVISVSAGMECYGFNSLGGSDNRLISQRLTFRPIFKEPVPCLSASNINLTVNGLTVNKIKLSKEFSSSKGEIMLPGIWNFGTGLNNVLTLIKYSSPIIDNSKLLSDPVQFSEFEDRMQNKYGLRPFGLVPGTSFAAPRMSFAMAVYLATVKTSYCRIPNRAVIGFKYASFPTGPWNDYDLGYQSAIVNCDDFYNNTKLSSLLGLTVH